MKDPLSKIINLNVPEPLRFKPEDKAKAKPETENKESGEKLDGRSLLRARIIQVDKPATTETKPKPEPKKNEKDQPPTPQAVDPEVIARAAAKGAVDAISERDRQKEEERKRQEEADRKAKESAAKKPENEIPERFAAELKTYEQLEKLDPARFSGIRQKLVAYDAAETKYAADWQKANPGKQFDPESEEHNEFYRGIEITVDQKTWEKAKEQANIEGVTERVTKTIESKQQDEKRKQEQAARIKQAGEEISSTVIGMIVSAAKNLTPGIEIDKDLPDREKIQKIEEMAPAFSVVAEPVIQRHAALVSAAINISSGIAEFNEANPAHREYASALSDLVTMVLQEPEDSMLRVDQSGRTYVTPSQYAKLSEEERQQHFTTSQADVMAFLEANLERDISERLKKIGVPIGTPATKPTPRGNAESRNNGGAPKHNILNAGLLQEAPSVLL